MKRGAGIRIWVTAGTPSVVRLQGEGRPAFCLDGVREGSDEGRMGLWPSNRFLLSGGRTGAVRLSGGRPEAGFWSEAAGEGHLSRRPQRGGGAALGSDAKQEGVQRAGGRSGGRR